MSVWKRSLLCAAAAAFVAFGSAAQAFEVGIIGFQFSSETHARVANAAAEAAKAKGWTVTLLNSEGSLPKHAEGMWGGIDRLPPYCRLTLDPFCIGLADCIASVRADRLMVHQLPLVKNRRMVG